MKVAYSSLYILIEAALKKLGLMMDEIREQTSLSDIYIVFQRESIQNLLIIYQLQIQKKYI